MAEGNEALAHRFHMDIFQEGTLDAADEILNPASFGTEDLAPEKTSAAQSPRSKWPPGALCRRPPTSTASPRLRWRPALRLQNELAAAPGRRGGKLRAARPGNQRGRARDLALRDALRDGMGPHGEHPRLRPVHGSEPQREPLGDSVGQHAAYLGGWRGRRLRGRLETARRGCEWGE